MAMRRSLYVEGLALIVFVVMMLVVANRFEPAWPAHAGPALQLSPVPTLNRWVDRPPLAAGSVPVCPDAGQWLLLYWGGADGVDIATAAQDCANADRYWASRSGQWLGYAPGAPGASDTWNVAQGEAHFVHGR
jgi:hypothetical protein